MPDFRQWGCVLRTETIRDGAIAVLALVAIAAHLALLVAGAGPSARNVPLFAALAGGGTVLVLRLARKAARGDFGSDQLAGVSIVAAVYSASISPARSSS